MKPAEQNTTLVDVLIFMQPHSWGKVWGTTLQKHFPISDLEYLVSLGILGRCDDGDRGPLYWVRKIQSFREPPGEQHTNSVPRYQMRAIERFVEGSPAPHAKTKRMKEAA